MNHAGLSLDQAPPLSVPSRFFLTTPVFGVLAACILLWSGPEIFSSRQAPHALAFTHSLTLGFICMTMFGAMQQLLPVLVGSPARRPGASSTTLHALLTLGALAMILGFLSDQKGLLLVSLALLFLAFALFLGITTHGLARAKARTPTVVSMWLASTSLGIAITLGLFSGIRRLLDDTHHVGDIHLTWALTGWVGLMVMGIAYEVVPMFQLTPVYPDRMRRALAPLLFACMALYTCLRFLPEAWQQGPLHPFTAIVLLLAGFSAFALTTLRLQQQRRRKLPDVTLDYWRLGMICLLVFSLLWIAGPLLVPSTLIADGEVFLGLLLIVGVILSLICGMLYKIVPFLLWFHLQSSLEEYVKLPSMKELLPDAPARRQLHVHIMSLILLLAASMQPSWFTYPAALLFAASSIMLGANLLTAYRKYRETRSMLETLGES